MNGFDFDVVVAGAGPAGAIAAYHLAAAGWRVCVLDKAALPRLKICAGGVSAKALRLLPFDIAPVVDQRMDGALLSHDLKHFFSLPAPNAGVLVQRDRFDHFLVQQAQARGAVIKAPCTLRHYTIEDGVRIATDQGPLRCRVLIGADGANSRVRQIGWPRHRVHYAFASETLLPYAQLADALRNQPWLDTGALASGYGWVFPKADHYNVGVYRWRKSPDSTSMQQTLRRFLEKNSVPGSVQEILSAPIPIAPAARQLACEHVLLCGDAAGLGEALLGEGIYYALFSGSAAATAVDAHLRHGAPLARYDSALRPLRQQLFYARLLAAVVYRAPRAVYHALLRHRLIGRNFAGLVSGDCSYRACFFRTLLALPLALLPVRLPACDNRPGFSPPPSPSGRAVE